MLTLEKNLLTDFREATCRSWLETNGLGGYAAGTLAGARTQGYHGLLVAGPGSLPTPHVLLSTLEEALIIDDTRYEFSTQQYHDAIHPHGYSYLERFRLDPFPIWTYRIGDFQFEKAVFLVHGENTVVIIYQPLSLGPARFELRPLLAYRDYRRRQQENSALRREPDRPYQVETGRLEVTPYTGMPPLQLLARHADFLPDGYWYRRFIYPADRDPSAAPEDLYSYGVFIFNLDSLHPTAYLVATTEDYESISLERIIQMRRREINRRAQILDAAAAGEVFLQDLARAADAFLVSEPPRNAVTITPGYPPPASAGASALASLPGLTLSTRRYDKAKALLQSYLDAGLFCPTSAPACPEEPLWFLYALYQYAHATFDYEFVGQRAYPIVAEWMRTVLRGESPSLVWDRRDRLMRAIRPGGPDPAAGARPRRLGQTVDVNALWYNSLCIMARFAEPPARRADHDLFSEQARRMAAAFPAAFWNPTAGYLYDAVEGPSRDDTLRPYQILSISLPFALLSREQARSVVEAVRTRLLTPYGLQEVAGPRADTPAGRSVVWPWLIGPFATAYLKAYGQSHVRRRYLESWLRSFRAHLREAAIGTVSECFLLDDASVVSDGCVACARSVAELLRVGRLLTTGGADG